MEDKQKLLESIIEIIGDTKEFCVEQAPDVIREFLMCEKYYFFISLILAVALTTFISIGIKLFSVGKKIVAEQGTSYYNNDEILYYVFGLLLIVVGSVAPIACIINMAIRFPVFITPKWHLVNYFIGK